MKTHIGLIGLLLLVVLLQDGLAQPTRANALAQMEQLNQQVIELYQQGKYAEAIPLVEKVLASREQLLGPEHPDVANSLGWLAELYHDMGDYAKAEPLYHRALAIQEKVLGSEHPDTANNLNNLALLYVDMGAYANAEPPPNPSQDESVRSAAMRGFSFTRLAGTREEIMTIQTLLGQQNTLLYAGKAAREVELFQHPSPRILHLATHGFFLEDQDLSAFAPLTSGEEMALSVDRARPKIVKDTAQPLPPLPQFENPLVRSGIVLAGANKAIGIEGETEGIVTAEKILGLKLRGTELVVLSACETGMGDVQIGEGVYGLRRAFTQAGAKSLVMSLWSVPDTETKELMV